MSKDHDFLFHIQHRILLHWGRTKDRMPMCVFEAAVEFPCHYAGPHFMALQLTDRSVEVAPVGYAGAFSRL